MSRKRLIEASLILGLIGVALAGMLPRSARAKPQGYMFTPIAFLEDPAPGGGAFDFDFEPNSLSNRGEAGFGADLTLGGEGVFLTRKGQISLIARVGQPAPSGGTFASFFLGPTALNDEGDMAFTFTLSPLSFPFGMNSGIYRFSHSTKMLTPVVVPSVTPVPGTSDTFVGSGGTTLNNRGEIAFGGIILTANGIHVPSEAYIGLGVGLFLADKHGQVSSVVLPGDPAPGGGTFDFTIAPWINDAGDIAFGAHVAGEECITAALQADVIFCGESVYVMKAATGAIQSIAHQGESAPGGGVFRHAFGPVLNNQGDMVFLGDLTTENPATPEKDFNQVLGVFLHSKGHTIRVAGPGAPMPGGGHLVTASFILTNFHLNNPGDIAFNAVLDTDVDDDKVADTGLFVWSRGSLSLVARTGTVIPGVGTINRLAFGSPPLPPLPGVNAVPTVNGGAINNDRGQVLFGGTLEDGRGALLVATPSP